MSERASRRTLRSADPNGEADIAVAMVAPRGWFDDDHGPNDRPRCCEAVACVETTLRAVGQWEYEDTIALARAVTEGMEAIR